MAVIEKLAGRLAEYLAGAGFVRGEDREVVAFGLFRLLADIEQVVILAVVSLLLGVLPAMGTLLVCYGYLRRYIGGAHAKTHGGCLAAYTTAATAAALLASACPIPAARLLAALLPAVTLTVVLTRAPAMHPNSPKSAASLARFKRRGRMVAGMELALLSPGALLAPPWLAAAILGGSAGGFLAACTLLLPMPTGKEGKA